MAAYIMVFHERKWDRYRRQRRGEEFITKCRRVLSIIETGGGLIYERTKRQTEGEIMYMEGT